MNRKNVALSAVLVLGSMTVMTCAIQAQMSQTNRAVNSQKEFDTAFQENVDAATLNRAGHAFDNQNARLFWFTDLEAAKQQAKLEGKPILSLRLLGKLSDEYSCANSRFFRVLLYGNKQINPILREKFVLHWSSERAVPVVTIDFGDGRKIKQTLTGNSAHYLLDETGRPLDVLPGLYSPDAFKEWLNESQKLAVSWNAETGDREQTLKDWHKERIATIWKTGSRPGTDAKWLQQQIEISLTSSPLVAPQPQLIQSIVPARIAAPLYVSKVAVERPLLNATRLFSTSARVQDWTWGNPFKVEVKLDEDTKVRVKSMNPRLNNLPSSPGKSEPFMLNSLPVQVLSNAQMVPSAAQSQKLSPFDAMVQQLEQNVSLDTASNRFSMEIPIHALFAKGLEGGFESLNRKIYDTLFLTPKSDPYLGLGSDGTFTGLQNGGIIE